MPRRLPIHSCLVDGTSSPEWDSPSHLGIAPGSWHGLDVKRWRQAEFSSFLSNGTTKAPDQGAALLAMNGFGEKGASKTAFLFGFGSKKKDEEAGEDGKEGEDAKEEEKEPPKEKLEDAKDYCCRGYKDFSKPCNGFRVDRQCMAEELGGIEGKGLKGFGDKIANKSEKFAESSKKTFCCERKKCGMLSWGSIKVPIQERLDPPPEGREEEARLSTADIIENPKDCDFYANESFHGCRAKGIKVRSVKYQAVGHNFQKCVKHPGSENAAEAAAGNEEKGEEAEKGGEGDKGEAGGDKDEAGGDKGEAAGDKGEGGDKKASKSGKKKPHVEDPEEVAEEPGVNQVTEDEKEELEVSKTDVEPVLQKEARKELTAAAEGEEIDRKKLRKAVKDGEFANLEEEELEPFKRILDDEDKKATDAAEAAKPKSEKEKEQPSMKDLDKELANPKKDG